MTFASLLINAVAVRHPLLLSTNVDVYLMRQCEHSVRGSILAPSSALTLVSVYRKCTITIKNYSYEEHKQFMKVKFGGVAYKLLNLFSPASNVVSDYTENCYSFSPCVLMLDLIYSVQHDVERTLMLLICLVSPGLGV